MYLSRYLKNIYKSGVKLYLYGRPVTPLALRAYFGGEPAGFRLRTVYDIKGALAEVHFKRA